MIGYSSQLKIDCYPDEGFAEMYGYESSSDQPFIKSRTGFVITVVSCPVLWQSKLQTETGLSSRDGEVAALDHSC